MKFSSSSPIGHRRRPSSRTSSDSGKGKNGDLKKAMMFSKKGKNNNKGGSTNPHPTLTSHPVTSISIPEETRDDAVDDDADVEDAAAASPVSRDDELRVSADDGDSGSSSSAMQRGHHHHRSKKDITVPHVEEEEQDSSALVKPREMKKTRSKRGHRRSKKDKIMEVEEEEEELLAKPQEMKKTRSKSSNLKLKMSRAGSPSTKEEDTLAAAVEPMTKSRSTSRRLRVQSKLRKQVEWERKGIVITEAYTAESKSTVLQDEPSSSRGDDGEELEENGPSEHHIIEEVICEKGEENEEETEDENEEGNEEENDLANETLTEGGFVTEGTARTSKSKKYDGPNLWTQAACMLLSCGQSAKYYNLGEENVVPPQEESAPVQIVPNDLTVVARVRSKKVDNAEEEEDEEQSSVEKRTSIIHVPEVITGSWATPEQNDTNEAIVPGSQPDEEEVTEEGTAKEETSKEEEECTDDDKSQVHLTPKKVEIMEPPASSSGANGPSKPEGILLNANVVPNNTRGSSRKKKSKAADRSKKSSKDSEPEGNRSKKKSKAVDRSKKSSKDSDGVSVKSGGSRLSRGRSRSRSSKKSWLRSSGGNSLLKSKSPSRGLSPSVKGQFMDVMTTIQNPVAFGRSRTPVVFGRSRSSRALHRVKVVAEQESNNSIDPYDYYQVVVDATDTDVMIRLPKSSIASRTKVGDEADHLTFADLRREIEEVVDELPFDNFKFTVEADGMGVSRGQEKTWRVRDYDLTRRGGDGSYKDPYRAYVKEDPKWKRGLLAEM